MQLGSDHPELLTCTAVLHVCCLLNMSVKDSALYLGVADVTIANADISAGCSCRGGGAGGSAHDYLLARWRALQRLHYRGGACRAQGIALYSSLSVSTKSV